MKSKHLGIVYRKDGTDPGTRVYHVEIFEVIHSDHVVVKNSGKEKPEVFIGGKKLNPTDATTYDEKQNTGLSTNISLWINKFWENISFIIFKGKKHGFCFILVLEGVATALNCHLCRNTELIFQFYRNWYEGQTQPGIENEEQAELVNDKHEKAQTRQPSETHWTKNVDQYALKIQEKEGC